MSMFVKSTMRISWRGSSMRQVTAPSKWLPRLSERVPPSRGFPMNSSIHHQKPMSSNWMWLCQWMRPGPRGETCPPPGDGPVQPIHRSPPRLAQQRSRWPHVFSWFTSYVVPSTFSSPVQRPMISK